MTSRPLERVDALVQVALRLARSAPTGRIALARLAEQIESAWIPRPWGDTIAAELVAAHEAARSDPLGPRQVERALKSAWGTSPTDELDDLELEPTAITPAAQVHRATLDGQPVAVKLLRPGLAASVRQDLAMLDSLLAPLSAAFPALDPRTILQEVRDRVLEELDLEHEAQNQRRFHRALRNHPAFTVPAPVTRLATDSVLVSEWIEGTRIADAPDPDQAAARLLTFVLGATRSGAMHVDPHPEDVLITPEGKLAVLDFGLVRAVKPDRVNDTAAALDAFAARDAETFGTLTAKLGSLPAEHAELALDLAYDALGDLAGPEPTRLDTPAVISARDRLLGRPRDLATLLTKGSLPPDDLWPARAAAQLFGSIALIGATGSWLELSRAALKDGWDAAT